MRRLPLALAGAVLATAGLPSVLPALGAGDETAPRITKVSDSPDPFSPNGDGKRESTTIRWTHDERALVTIKLFKPGGREVRDLMRETLAPGDWKVRWGGRDNSGHLVPQGTYNYRIRAEDRFGNHSRRKGSVTVNR